MSTIHVMRSYQSEIRGLNRLTRTYSHHSSQACICCRLVISTRTMVLPVMAHGWQLSQRTEASAQRAVATAANSSSPTMGGSKLYKTCTCSNALVARPGAQPLGSARQ